MCKRSDWDWKIVRLIHLIKEIYESVCIDIIYHIISYHSILYITWIAQNVIWLHDALLYPYRQTAKFAFYTNILYNVQRKHSFFHICTYSLIKTQCKKSSKLPKHRSVYKVIIFLHSLLLALFEKCKQTKTLQFKTNKPDPNILPNKLSAKDRSFVFFHLQ